MTTKKILIFLFLSIFSCFATAIIAQSQIPDAPQPARYMVDMANMLTPEEAQSIEDKLYAYYKAQQTQIIIVTVVSLEGNTVEAYAEALFKKWGIGDKDRKDGLLLLISKNDRKMRIEVGYGLEGTITDAFAYEVITDNLKPNFKNNDFYAGIDAATKNIIGKLTPNYSVTPTTIDTIRQVEKQQKEKSTQAERNRRKNAIEKEKQASDKQQNMIGLTLFIFIAIIIFLIVLSVRMSKKSEQEKYISSRARKAYNEKLAALKILKNSEAYKSEVLVRKFMDEYHKELNTVATNLELQEILMDNKIIALNGYRYFIECYQKSCVLANFPPNKYYPTEARRVVEANKAEMAKLSSVAIVSSINGKKLMSDIAAILPQVKLSTHFQNLFDALPACPNETQKGESIVLPLIEAFEKSDLFAQLIEKYPQKELFFNDDAEAIQFLSTKIYNVCLQTHNIKSIAKTTDESLMSFIDHSTTEANTILQKFAPITTIDHNNLDYNLLRSYLKDPEINSLIDDFPKRNYPAPFQLLIEKIKTFGTPSNLTAKYSGTHTTASITALINGISSDTAAAQAKFGEGDYAAAFPTVVNMFNGIFSTSAYLNKYLVAIATRSYTSSSTSSSYSSSSSSRSSYSDYTPPPPYSDYTPPPAYSDSSYSDSSYSDSSYSDSSYSDSSYSDSSYGGGSSGGGGASGGW